MPEPFKNFFNPKMIAQMGEHLGPERKAAVSREITKIHEETIRGTLQELVEQFRKGTVKGEIVIVVGGPDL